MNDQEYVPGTMLVWRANPKYESTNHTFVVLYLSESKINFKITQDSTYYNRISFSLNEEINIDTIIRSHISIVCDKSKFFIVCPKRGVVFERFCQED